MDTQETIKLLSEAYRAINFENLKKERIAELENLEKNNIIFVAENLIR